MGLAGLAGRDARRDIFCEFGRDTNVQRCLYHQRQTRRGSSRKATDLGSAVSHDSHIGYRLAESTQ